MKLLESYPSLGKELHPGKLISRVASTFVTENNLSNETANGIVGALRARDFRRAVELAGSVPLQQYGTWQEHLAMNQLSLFVRKVPWDIPDVDPEANAMKKFLMAEHRCRRLNQRFFAEKRASREPYSSFRAIARSWIAKVLGESPPLAQIYEHCDYSSGAVVGIGGENTSVFRKLDSESISMTPTALPHFIEAVWCHAQYREQFLETNRGVACHDPERFRALLVDKVKLVGYNELFMVPKDSDCHRVAGKEPCGNSFLQKGVDVFMRKRLKRMGLDLSLQEPNQRLAYAGSVESNNPTVTIDLSSASDSISIGLVKDLLPPDWFGFLNSIRSPSFNYDGDTSRYSKFCSMGNGFCFPLETLIFASLIHAAHSVTGDTLYRVYGDDIIVRQSSALLVLELLKWAGFKANTKKTFVFGPFRESCGADWFGGVNVRPYTLDFLPSKGVDLMRIHNGLLYNPLVGLRSESCRQMLRLLAPEFPKVSQTLVDVCNYAHQAFVVSHDEFLSHKGSRWSKDTYRWTWAEFELSGMPVAPFYTPSAQMYGLLRGARPSSYRLRINGKMVGLDHLPGATLRRKTRLRVVRNDDPKDPPRKLVGLSTASASA